MTTKTQLLIQQYNQRLMAMIDTFQGEIRPDKENFAIQASVDLYKDTLRMDDQGGITYLGWMETIERFFKNPHVLAIDPDDKLEQIADKILASPDLITYYRNDIKPEQPLDREQLLIFIKYAENVMSTVR